MLFNHSLAINVECRVIHPRYIGACLSAAGDTVLRAGAEVIPSVIWGAAIAVRCRWSNAGAILMVSRASIRLIACGEVDQPHLKK